MDQYQTTRCGKYQVTANSAEYYEDQLITRELEVYDTENKESFIVKQHEFLKWTGQEMPKTAEFREAFEKVFRSCMCKVGM